MKAFVLMPFETEFDAVFEHLIEPALMDAGYEVARADRLIGQRNVIRDIVEAISTADLVVAELTGVNPNVFYELGLAHGLGVPTVLIAQDVDDIPFDLRNYRVQLYSTRFDEIEELRSALTEIGQAHARGALTFGSPISDFLPRESTGSPAVTDGMTSLFRPEEEGPSGFLDRMIEIERANEQLEEVMGRIAHATEDVGEDIRRSTERIGALNPDVPGVVVQARRLASIAASDLTRYAERVEGDMPDLEAAVDLLSESGLGHLNWLMAQEGEEFQEQRLDARDSMGALLEASSQALPSIAEFRDTVLGLRDTTRELDRAVHRVGSALGKVLALIERTKAFAEEGLAILAGSEAA